MIFILNTTLKRPIISHKILDKKLSQIGSKGLFTQEIEQMLLNSSVDMAVHSLKDMPTILDENLQISAYIKRDTNKDIIVFSKDYKYLNQLPKNAKIGTSSLRREAQLKHISKDYKICNIRGNIHTRLEKMKQEDFDAIILAKAGLLRLDMLDKVAYQELDFISAPGQGCICVETASHNLEIINLVKSIDDPITRYCTNQERKFLNYIDSGCHAPLGAYCYYKNSYYNMDVFVDTSQISIKRLDTVISNCEKNNKIYIKNEKNKNIQIKKFQNLLFVSYKTQEIQDISIEIIKKIKELSI